MMKQNSLGILLAGFLCISLAGCGDGDATVDLIDGVFLDSAVEGLSYGATTQFGVTDENGGFTVDRGQQVIFSIGDLTLPGVLAKEIITPLDIFGTTSVDDPRVVNLARLLQSLDADGYPDNGIVISPAAVMAATPVDFASATFETDVASLVANSGSQTVALIDGATALAHLSATLTVNSVPTGDCSADHPLVGETASLSTIHHQVAGDVRVVDNCTLEVTNFVFDGLGPRVFFYAAKDSQFGSDAAFVVGPRLNGTVYSGNTLTLKLPAGKTLDDMNSISVWCADVRIDFGSAVFN